MQATGTGLSPPLDAVDVLQAVATVTIKEGPSNPISITDVQALLLWVLGQHTNPSWVFVKNKPLLQHVVLVQANGISPSLFAAHADLLPVLRQFGTPAVLRGNNTTMKPSDTTQALLSTSVGSAKRKRETTAASQQQQQPAHSHAPPNGSPHAAAHHQNGATGQRQRAMVAHKFPVPGLDEDGQLRCPEGYIATLPSGRVGEDERMVALDCEMCITARGYDLTRATLVDSEGKVLLDELCVPDIPITDYNTRYSGITEEMLADCTNTLGDIQARVMAIVGSETLLVGHALENDLRALRLTHARIVDTGTLFPHPRGLPYKTKLKILATKFLKRTIQESSHDSVIDAVTALDLAKLKIKHGPAFGTGERRGGPAFKLTDVLADHGRRTCLVDRHDMLSRWATGATSAVPVTNDVQAAATVAKQAWSNRGCEQRQGSGRTPAHGGAAAAVQAAVASQGGGVAAAAAAAQGGAAAAVVGQGNGGAGGAAAVISRGWDSSGTAGAGSDPEGDAAKAGGFGLVWTQLLELHGWYQQRANQQRELQRQQHETQQQQQQQYGDPVPSLPAHTSTHPTAQHPTHPATTTTPPPPPSSAHHPAPNGVGGSSSSSSGAGASGAPQPAGQASTGHTNGGAVGGVAGAAGADPSGLAGILARVDHHLSQILEGLPPRTLMMVVTGQGDTPETSRRLEHRCKRKAGLDGMQRWTVAEEEDFNKHAEAELLGLVFCLVKQ
ncbi:MAG: hypothetical protein WDW38_010802 [Sanguina aurantia]